MLEFLVCATQLMDEREEAAARRESARVNGKAQSAPGDDSDDEQDEQQPPPIKVSVSKVKKTRADSAYVDCCRPFAQSSLRGWSLCCCCWVGLQRHTLRAD